tara:strand:+ start:297 stop:590 length:294 start_codon:yes stop_codon:yes gene_type:complete
MLSNTGVIAGNKNLLYVLKIPADIAVKAMKKRYGKVIFNISEANRNLLLPVSNPGAKRLMIFSEKIIPRKVIMKRIKAKLPWTYLINFFNSIGLLLL